MELTINPKYPSVDDLRKRAMVKMPKFAFEYLDGGCNEDINLDKNRTDIQKIELMPQYLSKFEKSEMKTELFGHTYDAPFGISPVGLQGLMWPNSPEILAKSAKKHNVPFILSTVTTSSIERIAEITEGKSWFQLYHPAEEAMKRDLLDRAAAAGTDVLVILADVPTFGYRPRDVRNGLAMPPSMSVKNIIEVMKKPDWALQTLIHGQPSFKTLEKYMPKGLNLKKLGEFMDITFSGRLNEDRIASIRDQWKGKLVIKGVVSEEDAQKSIDLGVDGIIVSNHGGRQLDAGQSSIVPMTNLAQKFGDQIKIMVDSGLRGGPDIARAMASGAEFTFMGRSFMYGVGALGNEGGDHTISLMKRELLQVMEQICCQETGSFKPHLIK
ncbi:alpha-hydroxy acid oxidase [Wenyingzhuangia sp. 2_MG-2023]|uniref:alpha-hydroxy acid oxidase n=1 Tax=Wenyingzhuangia sp. 2_MG-2023 TaxID=3062639 RepID=UPI0026E3A173|nr:alpha-hydroxy acid oxidase [Wenyingzhuangia sp. 2_MG-2023]MDO6736325.1 alpha-hydroxy acid oxidase [Wenyingzhuangia sp. 2_MG-2023]MDO6801370.1 alpha-hydroxy acid oxidase [Wenyingzhuangia sp. 1_MG-2023]